MSEASPHVYLESRYRKLTRDLPQTVFWCPRCKGHRRRKRRCARCEGYGKLTRDSVQELLARRILPAFGARTGKFHGAGREDIDVRMLGRGRPFVFEVCDPDRDAVDLAAIDARIGAELAGRVECAPLCPVARARVAELKEGRFAKRYRLGVALGGIPGFAPLALVGREFEVRQRTPRRVAHRRADLVRERRVAILAVRAPGERHDLDVEIETAHGTYVKEWVSGDGERSEPSLAALLGVPAVCAELDVLEILDDVPSPGAGVAGPAPVTER